MAPPHDLDRTINHPFTKLNGLWQVEQLPIKSEYRDISFASRSLAEAFKNNKFLDSLLLLFDGL